MRHDLRDTRGASAWRLCAPAALRLTRCTLSVAAVIASAIVAKEALHAPVRANDAPTASPMPMLALSTSTPAFEQRTSERRLREVAQDKQTVRQGAVDEQPETAKVVRWFDGRAVELVRTVRMRVTAYSPDAQSCGKWADGYTASGKSVWTNAGKLVAADTSMLPIGSLVSVPGYDDGAIVPVLDRGGAIKGRRLDVLYPTHERALEWGVQNLDVAIWQYVDDAAPAMPDHATYD